MKYMSYSFYFFISIINICFIYHDMAGSHSDKKRKTSSSTYRSLFIRNEKHAIPYILNKPKSDNTCSVCLQTFNNRWTVNDHMGHHRGEYICAICGMNCRFSSSYKRHCDSHTKSACFSCPLCYTTYTQKVNLLNHMVSHTIAYNCPHCSQKYKGRKACERLANHMQNTHQSSLTCRCCNQSFDNLALLKTHLQRCTRTWTEKQYTFKSRKRKK